jgi:ferrous iron transport protein B
LVYGAGEEADEQSATLRQAMRGARRADGSLLYTPLTALSLIVYFMIAMQCLSTFAIIRQESRSWRWPLFVLIYLNTLAYLATLLTYQVGRALGFS